MASKDSFNTGRMIIALILILQGANIFLHGAQTYEFYLNSLRQLVLPGSKPDSLAFGSEFTFQQITLYIIKGEGVVFLLSGFLLLFSYRKFASFLLLIAVGFIMATRDNPYLHNNMKSVTREKNEKLLGLLKNLVLVGAALLLMMDAGEPKVEIVERVSVKQSSRDGNEVDK